MTDEKPIDVLATCAAIHGAYTGIADMHDVDLFNAVLALKLELILREALGAPSNARLLMELQAALSVAAGFRIVVGFDGWDNTRLLVKDACDGVPHRELGRAWIYEDEDDTE